MFRNFTLLILSQHYPISQQFQVFSCENNVSFDADVAGFMQAAEQQASQHVMDSINAYAAVTVEH